MNEHDAAEVLRAYAPAATPLPECYRLAHAATDGRWDGERVEEAAGILGFL